MLSSFHLQCPSQLLTPESVLDGTFKRDAQIRRCVWRKKGALTVQVKLRSKRCLDDPFQYHRTSSKNTLRASKSELVTACTLFVASQIPNPSSCSGESVLPFQPMSPKTEPSSPQMGCFSGSGFIVSQWSTKTAQVTVVKCQHDSWLNSPTADLTINGAERETDPAHFPSALVQEHAEIGDGTYKHQDAANKGPEDELVLPPHSFAGLDRTSRSKSHVISGRAILITSGKGEAEAVDTLLGVFRVFSCYNTARTLE